MKSVDWLPFDFDFAGSPVIDHRNVSKECATNQRIVRLTPGRQIQSGKSAVHDELQRREVHLSEMEIYFLRTMGSGYRSAVNDWEIQA
jgi:hypothetical protein